jgi:hypothetical protein
VALGKFNSTINLSAGERSYPLKADPRPKGKATRVIITEYDLPRRIAMPHDVQMDSRGMLWYSDFGSQYVGRLDPKTGEATEYPIPVTKPSAGALANLGYRVCHQTVGNVLQRHGLPPAPERKRTTTWSAFIRTHLALLAGTDFFIAEVLTLRGSAGSDR